MTTMEASTDRDPLAGSWSCPACREPLEPAAAALACASCGSRYPTDERWQGPDFDELPLRSDSVDFVYSSAVLLHLPEQMVRRTLQEVVRVLRPGGVALFESCFIGWLNPDGAQTKLISSLARGRLRVAFVRTYRRKDVERLVSAVGRLSDVKIEPEGYRVLPKEVARVSMGRFKPAIARFNRRASERLRFKSFLVEGWSVQLVK